MIYEEVQVVFFRGVYKPDLYTEGWVIRWGIRM